MIRGRRTISQFMWGFQRSFRLSVMIEAGFAFEAIGFSDEPIVFLVGFQVAGDHAHSICVEPEDGPYSPTDFVKVPEKAKELYDLNPDSELFHSVADVHEKRHAALRDEMRAEAVAQVFHAHPAGVNRVFFASRSQRVGDYEVHVVLGVSSGRLAMVPQLQTTSRDRFRVAPSLVHALIYDILHRAFLALFFPDPGTGPRVLGASSAEIVRSATEEFVRSVFLCAGIIFGGETGGILNAISALPYEGRASTGSLILGKLDVQHVEVFLKLREPVKLQQTRAVRKLMEASGLAADLLVAEIEMGGRVYGFGRLSPDYDQATETVFGVSVLGRGAWDLTHGGEVLLSLRDGIAQLPVHILDVATFRDSVVRLLPGANLAKLESLAVAAAENDHGAMLVISSDASGEAERLTPQSWAVEPVPLSGEVLRQLTAMDGAVLVDPQGLCCAVGVILDGRAAGRGDPARGSRFNNAVRYLDTNPPPAVVVVYSADGSIDILPKLRPRIERERVIGAVTHYLDLAAARPPHAEKVSRAWDAVKALRFYLSEEQCLALNAARKNLDASSRDRVQIQIIENDLLPEPGMSDEYWI